MTKSKDLDNITGKTSFIYKEIWVFPDLAGILPFISNTEKSTFHYNRGKIKKCASTVVETHAWSLFIFLPLRYIL